MAKSGLCSAAILLPPPLPEERIEEGRFGILVERLCMMRLGCHEETNMLPVWEQDR